MVDSALKLYQRRREKSQMDTWSKLCIQRFSFIVDVSKYFLEFVCFFCDLDNVSKSPQSNQCLEETSYHNLFGASNILCICQKTQGKFYSINRFNLWHIFLFTKPQSTRYSVFFLSNLCLPTLSMYRETIIATETVRRLIARMYAEPMFQRCQHGYLYSCRVPSVS